MIESEPQLAGQFNNILAGCSSQSHALRQAGRVYQKKIACSPVVAGASMPFATIQSATRRMEFVCSLVP